MVHEVQMGTRKRMSFFRINEVLDMAGPDRNSKEFLSAVCYGAILEEVSADGSPITDLSGREAGP